MSQVPGRSQPDFIEDPIVDYDSSAPPLLRSTSRLSVPNAMLTHPRSGEEELKLNVQVHQLSSVIRDVILNLDG